MIQYGFAEAPGRFDHWGAGHVHTFPNEGSANGTVVFAPGDIVVLPYCRYVQDEVRLDIRDGFIRKIEGGLDAKLMSDWLDGNRRMRRIWTVTPSRISVGASIRRGAGTRSRSTAPIRPSPRRRPLLRRQFPVLDRPELARRRQAHDQGALRRAHAGLHRCARQRRDHRARQIHRRKDAGRVRAALMLSSFRPSERSEGGPESIITSLSMMAPSRRLSASPGYGFRARRFAAPRNDIA